MLLFSTILDIKDTITPDSFINLVLEWNETSTRIENKVQGIDWHGEHNVRYGSDDLWLQFVELAERSVLAVRHEKVTADGVTWDSDFVVNFAERKLAIRLDRTYSEEALVMDAAFSTPHIITLLIEHGFLKDDEELPVLRTPIYVTDDDLEMCQCAFSKEHGYRLPVVYVMKAADGGDPLSVGWLASRLKGAAHVLVEESAESCAGLRGLCGRAEAPFGGVRVFFPSEAVGSKKFFFRSATGNEEVRLEKVIRSVIQYGISQRVPGLYTWNGVNGALLGQQLSRQIEIRMNAESARQQAENEVEKVYEEFDEDLRTLQERVAELTRANEALQFENQGLRAKFAAAEEAPLIFHGEEEDFFEGEIRDMVLGVLTEALAATEHATRRADVLADVLESNPYYRLSEERKQRIKNLFKGYKSLTGAMRQELASLGFEITEAGKHYKITYRGDQRYMVTVGKTPSDNRSGSNNAAVIGKVML